MKTIAAILVLLAAPFVAAQECVFVSHEYCQIGCDDLGEWIVEGAPSLEVAQQRVRAFTGLSAISAFAVQLPSSFPPAAVIRRATPVDPAEPIDYTRPGLRWRVYSGAHAALIAAAESDVLGGWIYQGNDGASVVRVWWQACAEQPARMRPARR